MGIAYFIIYGDFVTVGLGLVWDIEPGRGRLAMAFLVAACRHARLRDMKFFAALDLAAPRGLV